MTEKGDMIIPPVIRPVSHGRSYYRASFANHEVRLCLQFGSTVCTRKRTGKNGGSGKGASAAAQKAVAEKVLIFTFIYAIVPAAVTVQYRDPGNRSYQCCNYCSVRPSWQRNGDHLYGNLFRNGKTLVLRRDRKKKESNSNQ